MADVLTMRGTPVVPVSAAGGVPREGLAERISRQWEGFYDAYHGLCIRGILQPGQPIIAEVGERRAVLLPSRRSWVEPDSIDLIKRGFRIMTFWSPDMWGYQGQVLIPIGEEGFRGAQQLVVRDLFQFLLGKNPNFALVEGGTHG